MFNTIVIGIDGSDPAENALRTGCDIAGKYGAAVHIIHTPRPDTTAFAMGSMAGFHPVVDLPDTEKTRKAAEAILAKGVKIAGECGQTGVATRIGAGDPAADIVALADECGADLIVTGRRGLGDVAGLFLGSTSHDVSKNAKCACLSAA